LHKIVSEAKAILDRILKNTEYTGVYEDPPDESREPTEREETFVQTPTPCPQKIAELKPPASDPKPFSKDLDLSSCPCLMMMNLQWTVMSHHYQGKKVMLVENLR